MHMQHETHADVLVYIDKHIVHGIPDWEAPRGGAVPVKAMMITRLDSALCIKSEPSNTLSIILCITRLCAQDLTVEGFKRDGTPIYFQHPAFQSAMMFSGRCSRNRYTGMKHTAKG